MVNVFIETVITTEPVLPSPSGRPRRTRRR